MCSTNVAPKRTSAREERLHVDGLRVGRLARSAEQVALARVDARREHELELLLCLEALGHHDRSPSRGEIPQRGEDLRRGLVGDRVLDEREVDLHDVERHEAQEAQPGVAGPDVVGGDPDAERATGLEPASQPGEVLDLLALGELEDDPLRRAGPGGRAGGTGPGR